MRWTLATLLACAAGAAADPASDAATMFRSRCASCHSVPDKTLATDQAWLDQINRTT